MQQIVYTTYDSRVAVTTPASECMTWLSNGGYWADKPRGFADEQVERQIASGIAPWAAKRFVYAMQNGGCTTAEALEIIKDRDCGHLGTGFEVWSPNELPDRWFRDAWRRSPNGGPIGIDLKVTKEIQFKRLRNYVKVLEQQYVDDINLFDCISDVPWTRIRDKILIQDTPEMVRAVWPGTGYIDSLLPEQRLLA